MDDGARKLIFYSSVGPDHDDSAWVPFTLARHALKASLEVEIVLVGAATGLMRAAVRRGLEGRPAEALRAVVDAGVPISCAPG